MGGVDKMLAPLAGEPLLLHSIRAFHDCEAVAEVVVVTREDLLEPVRQMVETPEFPRVRRVVPGGRTRAESSRHGLAALSGEIAVVLVHDGARPLISDALIHRVAEAAEETGAVLPGIAPVSTIKRAEGDVCAATLDRASLREAQTPQGFRREVLARAMAADARDGSNPTDEASSVERSGTPVALVEGERRNLKVTVPEDLAIAETILAGGRPVRALRVGVGVDTHRLEPGCPLVLGGVTIPFDRGLAGHSDADVLSHAVCDALLGAAAAGDIGDHFPDDDPRWKGVSGADLLRRTVAILRESGYGPAHVDATVSAEKPRLAPHRAEMVANIADALGLSPDRVSVQFTTTEGLGFVGRGEGMSATAVALLEESLFGVEAE
ncbi:MAG: bifunctional 2-C-methyl-D-erythritol 4-phosphate cytidylyltransferase/2-C-methyl-D-erythritol 2,4-cyclodiphosphate synthase [Gemmatimonadetes bacterium]|jgi:2-C-methyl-D-erythritol 2,4-cyclodiphosphate synthase/2-C-methyl-D-erythritol 4-phosphate cytidylyltransferase|nr:bifunctional 2-C-methyl-D-erythritol 4-phosphate cytidylyltransferase/2-C-methyl-D-erythritol 2,4-cyclodiphosphate synthase [Gemmatimonadota bacterium]